MTLILTLRDQGYILQVTDRLVTSRDKQVDPAVNKNILYHARNGLFAMGFTGWAILDHIPTDQWIAEKLLGHAYDRSKTSQGFGFGGPDPWLDIGQSMIKIRDELRLLYRRQPPLWQRGWTKDFFAILLGGYQWNSRGRVRPVIGAMVKPRQSTAFGMIWEDRNKYLTGNYSLYHEPVGNMRRDERDQMISRVRAGSNIDTVEAALVQTMQTVSDRNQVVGPHCMSILITPPTVGHARVRFIPRVAHAVQFSSRIGDTVNVPVAFSPHLIGPNLDWPPALLGGGTWEMQIGGYALHLEATGYTAGPVHGFLYGQPRNNYGV